MSDNIADANSTKALSNAIVSIMIEIPLGENNRIHNFLSFLFLIITVTAALLDLLIQGKDY